MPNLKRDPHLDHLHGFFLFFYFPRVSLCGSSSSIFTVKHLFSSTLNQFIQEALVWFVVVFLSRFVLLSSLSPSHFFLSHHLVPLRFAPHIVRCG